MARQNIYFLTAICLFRQGSRLRVVLYDTCFNKKKRIKQKYTDFHLTLFRLTSLCPSDHR